MKYYSISFDTADETRFSPCAIYITEVNEGIITDHSRTLIKPWCYPNFDDLNISIHGITPDDVANELEFPDLWNKILSTLDQNYLIAFNGGFHFSVLRNTLDYYDLEYPNCKIGCISILSKKTFPELGMYRQDLIEKHIGLKSINDASYKAAEIFNELIKKQETDFEKIFENKGITLGSFEKPSIYNPSLTKRIYKSSAEKYGLNNIDTDPKYHSPNSIFYESEVVFTGSLESMSRKDALQKVATIGGIPSDTLTSRTNYLVCGKKDMDKITPEKTTGKFKKAVSFAQKGNDIEIIDEITFLQNI